MAAGRALSVLLSAFAGLLFGACGGGGKTSPPAPAQRLVVPPIQAIDRSLPASAFGRNVAFIRSGCLEIPLGPGVGPPRSCEPGRETVAGRARTPATVVHLIARLPLRRPASLSHEVFFGVYASQGSGTCFTIVFAVATDPLTCDGNARCEAVCIRSLPEGREVSLAGPATGTYVLAAGTVPSSARALRLHFPGGTTVVYALRGPHARGFPERRVFMADLGRRGRPSRVQISAG